MSNETTKTAVPKLRFPEFRNEPGWTEEPLTKNLHEHKLKSDGKSEVHSVSVHKGVINQVEHLGRSFAAANTSKYSLAKPFDVIYTKSPTGDFPYGIVKQNLTGRSVILSPLYGVFTPTNQYIGNLFHFYFEYPSQLNNYLVSLVQKGAKNTVQISNDRFLSKGIYLPHNEGEQQKIAATLSSLDDLLTAQNAKLAALQAHKRGLMQGLFPAEGETVPKLRFPEFQDAAEWVNINFYDLIEEVLDFRGRTPQKIGMNWGKGNIVSLSANNVKNGFIDFNAECNLGSEALYEKWMGKVNLKKGDIVFTMEAPLGKALLIPNSQKYILSQRVVAFKTKNSVSNPFLIQLIWSEQFQREIHKLSTGSTAKGINQKTLKTIAINLPRQIAEQQKIADCLSSLDNRITAQTQKIEALKLHKKGLMQGLFPAAAEPTA